MASLFSEEFYRNITRYLNKNGLLVQWLQLYESNETILFSILRALAPYFLDYVVFSTGDNDILIVATNGGDLDRLEPWIFEQTRLKPEMSRVELNHLQDFKIRRIGNKTLLDPLIHASGAPPNSDYFPYVSHYAPKSRYLRQQVGLVELHLAPIPVLELLKGRAEMAGELSTQSRWFMPTYMQRQASYTVELLLSQKLPDADFVPKELNYLLRLLQLELSACAGRPMDEVLLRDNLFDVAKLTNPYLGTQLLEALWTALAGRSCHETLSDYTKNWLDLHRASGRRDAAAMAALASMLIEQAALEQITEEQSTYLLVAGLSGFLALGAKGEALEFMKKYNDLKLPMDDPPLYLRLLFSTAAGKVQTVKSQ